MTKRAALMTTRINIDVKFKTPEAAALGFGLLYHAAGVVQSGCRQQLVAGMADEATAENFLGHALRDEQARTAAVGLAGRIMEDSLRALADGLDVGEEAAPIALDREPAQIVRDGLVELIGAERVPGLDAIRDWSMELLESTAAWVMAVHEARRAGQPEPPLPREVEAELRACAEILGVEAREGCVLDELRTRVPSTVQTVIEGGDSKPLEFTGTFEPAAIATYEAAGEQRVRLVVDGVTMWASAVTIERLETPPAIGPDDFTEDDGAIEFYADGEYNTTTVERLTLRIEPRDLQGDEEPDDAGGLYDFTLYADGELHDGCSSLTEVANSYPNVAPTIDAWKAGRTVPFAVVITAARKLAGLTEPLPEETL